MGHLVVELIDEFIILAISYCMLGFSDYYPDHNVDARYMIGTIVNALVVFHIIYRQTVMLFDLVYSIYKAIWDYLYGDKGLTKCIPERSEKDLHFPFDVVEFDKLSENTTD